MKLNVAKKMMVAALFAAVSGSAMASCVLPNGEILDDGSLGARDMLPPCELPAPKAEAVAPTAPAAPKAFDPGVPAPKVDKSYYQGHGDRAVYHVNSKASGDAKAQEKAYLNVLGNLRNHINAVRASGATPDIKLILHGDGLTLLSLAKQLEFDVDAKLPGALDDLRKSGLEVDVCFNTLVSKRISVDQLAGGAAQNKIVPSGVAELARLQRLGGYAIVKP